MRKEALILKGKSMFLIMFRAKKILSFCVSLRVNRELFAREARRNFWGFSRVNCGFWYVSRAKREENFAGFQGQSEVFSTFSREARENFGVSWRISDRDPRNPPSLRGDLVDKGGGSVSVSTDGTTTKCFEGLAPNLAWDFSSGVPFLGNVNFPTWFLAILTKSSPRDWWGGITIGEHNIAIVTILIGINVPKIFVT